MSILEKTERNISATIQYLIKSIDLDPILLVFKNHDILKEFFLKRFFEILEVLLFYQV
jgi:hypothetical protein